MEIALFARAWLVFAAWCLAVFTTVEHLCPRRRARPRWRAIAIGIALLGVDAAVTRWLAVAGTSAALARTCAAWLLAEVLLYGAHRAQHALPLLWRFHRFHHRAHELTWAHAWHVHPIDVAVFAAAIAAATWIAGAPLPAAAAFVVGRRAWTVLLHANVAWRETALDRVIATPWFHHRHHREDLPAANFAATLTVLDRLFGSWSR
jgi:sterol desaturase/sphingolipid hydroxylase (fatty acid hydroxylase superfamily)